MMYSIRRRRHWTVEVRKDRIGGHNYYAWPGASANRCINPPVQGWAQGGKQDALAEAVMDIDRLDGKPESLKTPTRVFLSKVHPWMKDVNIEEAK